MKVEIILYCTASLTFAFYFLVQFNWFQHYTNKQISVKPYLNHSSFPKDILYLIFDNNHKIEELHLYI